MCGIIKCHCVKQILTTTKLRLCNISTKLTLIYGSVVWVMNKKDEKREVQVRFLRLIQDQTTEEKKIDIRDLLKLQSR